MHPKWSGSWIEWSEMWSEIAAKCGVRGLICELNQWAMDRVDRVERDSGMVLARARYTIIMIKFFFLCVREDFDPLDPLDPFSKKNRRKNNMLMAGKIESGEESRSIVPPLDPFLDPSASEQGFRWFILRVTARRPSIGDCPLRKVRRELARPLGSAATVGAPHQPARAEFVVEAILRRRGIEAWVPVSTIWHRQNRYDRRRKRVVYAPILTGYVLALLPPAPNWHTLMNCPMITGVVGVGDQPFPLRDQDVARLKAIEAKAQAETWQRMMPTGRAFSVGDEVEVLGGAMEGARLPVVEIAGDVARFVSGSFRVSIGLEKLGKVV